MNRKPGILLLICLSLNTRDFAQQFGGTPPSIKWNQVNTPAVRVIYPNGLDSAAKRIAAVTYYLNQHTSATAGDQKRKINIVLHNLTTVANAYVGLAPWRSEFNLTPEQNSFDLGSIPWPDDLAIHEYRHVQQFMNYRKGLSKFLYYIFGEQGQALANSGAVPNWFFEGDAVFQETSVSEQGRGRLPYFFNGYRSLWRDQKKYRYMKLRNGSLRDFTPDHYPLGYMLVGYGREKYGTDFWKQVTEYSVRYRSLFYPFQHAVKKYSGIRFKIFVTQALGYFQQQSDSTNSGAILLTKPAPKYNTDYVYPYYINNDTVIVLKKSYRKISGWYFLTSQGEHRIRTKDISIDDYYSYSNGKIIYIAFEPDARWGWKDYSVIKILDLHTMKQTQIAKKTKYFAPDLSADGSRIITVETNPDLSCTLNILDANNGSVIQKIPNPNHNFYTYPKWLDGNRAIACVRSTNGTMAIAVINLKDGETQNITPVDYKVKGYPYVKGDTILFTANSGYHDDIFAVDLNTKNLFKLSNEELGAYQAVVDDHGNLLYSSFTSRGYQIKRKTLSTSDWQPLQTTMTLQIPNLYLPTALQQNGGNILDKIDSGNFITSSYKGSFHMSNFHSWRPYYDNPDWSFTAYSENVLNTLQASVYYNYNENERSHKLGLSAVYAKWFPWLTTGLSYTFDRSVSDTTNTYRWNELNWGLGFNIPLNLSKNRWYKNLSLASSINNKQVYYKDEFKDQLGSPQFFYLQSTVSWVSQTQKARQNIYPHWAQSFYLQHRVILDNYNANQFLATGNLYFRGIGINHSLVVSAAYQMRDTANEYRFDNNFPFARGYENVDAPRMWKWSVNYNFPICYPDWGFAQLVYFYRIRANIFYDDARAKSLRTGEIFSFRSLGSELFFDTQWWNEQPLSFGIRYSHLLDNNLNGSNGRNIFEIVLPVILSR